jgi:hypothetical protein
MSDQLKTDELQLLISLVREYMQQHAISNTISGGTDALGHSLLLCRKLEAAVKVVEKQQQQIGSIPAETFPTLIGADEAQAYSARGRDLILKHAKTDKLPEHTDMDLGCILVAMTTGLVQTTGAPRDIFCNNKTTNVMYAALKTAFRLGELESYDKTT